jgi:hypothetical protein
MRENMRHLFSESNLFRLIWWFPSLSIILKMIDFCSYLWPKQYSIVYIDNIFFGQLGWFYNPAIVNNAAINIYGWELLCQLTLITSGIYPSGIYPAVVFWIIWQTNFQIFWGVSIWLSIVVNFHSHQKYKHSFSPVSSRICYLLIFF